MCLKDSLLALVSDVLVFKDGFFYIMPLNTSLLLHVHNQRNSVLFLEEKNRLCWTYDRSPFGIFKGNFGFT